MTDATRDRRRSATGRDSVPATAKRSESTCRARAAENAPRDIYGICFRKRRRLRIEQAALRLVGQRRRYSWLKPIHARNDAQSTRNVPQAGVFKTLVLRVARLFRRRWRRVRCRRMFRSCYGLGRSAFIYRAIGDRSFHSSCALSCRLSPGENIKASSDAVAFDALSGLERHYFGGLSPFDRHCRRPGVESFIAMETPEAGLAMRYRDDFRETMNSADRKSLELIQAYLSAADGI